MKKKEPSNTPRSSGKRRVLQNLVSVTAVIGFLASTAVLLYPVISDRWNRQRDMELIKSYNRMIESADPKQFEESRRLAEAFNVGLVDENRNIVTDAKFVPDSYYESMLTEMHNGMICYIEIPCVDVTEPVYHYSTDESLSKGIGHIHGSSLPIGGKTTHSVLTGHRGLPNQKFFSDLDKMKIGDKFYIHVLGETLAYQVIHKEIIEPTDVSGLMIEDDRDLMTLITCDPYGVNTQRLVLTGERVPFDQNDVKDGLVTTEKHQKVVDPAIWVFFGFVLFIAILVSAALIRMIIRQRIRKKKDSHNDAKE